MPFRFTSWFDYWLRAKGPHGVHSPFVYEFTTRVLKGKIGEEERKIEALRKTLSHSTVTLQFPDFGAGSAGKTPHSGGSRSLGDIAARSARRLKAGSLLSRIVRHYQPSTILELGTNLGISGLYLLSGNPGAKLITLEGAEALANIARSNFEKMGRPAEIITGEFSSTLPQVLDRPGFSPGLVFIDGNHRKAPTLEYLFLILPYCKPGSVIILDDIHWSKEMEEAWQEIRTIPECTLTIDLFQFGIIFPYRNQAKEDFVLRG